MFFYPIYGKHRDEYWPCSYNGLASPAGSYGGSALLTSMFLLGIVFNIDITSRKLEGYLGD